MNRRAIGAGVLATALAGAVLWDGRIVDLFSETVANPTTTQTAPTGHAGNNNDKMTMFPAASAPQVESSASQPKSTISLEETKSVGNCDVSSRSGCQYSTNVPEGVKDKINNGLTSASDSLRKAKENPVGHPDHVYHIRMAMGHFLNARHENVTYAFNNNSGIYATTVSLDIELKDPNQLAKLYADSLRTYLQKLGTDFKNETNALERQLIATQVRDSILEFDKLLVGYLASNKSIVPNGSSMPYTLPIVFQDAYIKNPSDSSATVKQDELAKSAGFPNFRSVLDCGAMNLNGACFKP